MKINRFMGHIDSMARQNRFEIQIFGPEMHMKGLRMRGLRISKANVPGKKFVTESYSEIPGGPTRKYLQRLEFDQEVTVTFMSDNTFEDRMIIDTWMESMIDHNYAMRYPWNDDGTPGYYGRVVIRQLDRSDFPIYEVELIDAFPEVLGGLSFDSSSSAIQTFDVTFGYRMWTSKYENSPSNSILGALFNKVGRKIKGKIKKKVEDKIFGG